MTHLRARAGAGEDSRKAKSYPPAVISRAASAGAERRSRPPRTALDKKGNKTSPLAETAAQRARRLRGVAAKWLRGIPMSKSGRDHAVTTCGGYAGFGVEVYGQRGVMVANGRHGAFVRHAVTCGSISACPVCAGKVARVRCDQVRDAVDAHQEQGGTVAMLTLTHGHKLGEALKPHIQAQQKRWSAMKSGKAWGKLCARTGLQGGVTAREVTHGASGWHPHLHVLLFFAPGTTTAQVYEFLQWVQKKWRALAEKSGFACSDQAQHFRLASSGKAAGDYLTKHGVEWEITHGHLKAAGRGGRSPWQMLEAGTAHDRALFVEFATAFKGVRMLTWFGDCNAFTAQDDDESAVKLADEKAADVAVIPDSTWRRVVEIGAESSVFQAAEKGFDGETGWLAVSKLLTFLECGACFPPDAGERFGKKTTQSPGFYQYRDHLKCSF